MILSDRPEPAILKGNLSVFRQGAMPDRLSLLIYGTPGVGKTVLAATADDDERTAPVLFVDSEGGRLSISHRSNLIVFPFNDFSRSMNELLDYFYGPTGFQNPDGFKTIVVDSLTDVARRAMDEVMSEPNRSRSHEDVPEFSDWNRWTNQMWKLIKTLRDFPQNGVNIIVTALEREEDGRVFPEFQGRRITPLLPAYFDTVGRLYVASGLAQDGRTKVYERKLLLSSEVRYMAKDRSNRMGMLPREVSEPTIGKLLDRITEGKQLAQLQGQEG